MTDETTDDMDTTTAYADAKRSAEDPSGLIERLAEKLGRNGGAAAVFGQPVEREGVTVIPVARARWAFGAGAGTGPAGEPGSAEGEVSGGSGGGGVAGSTPVGFIEITAAEARFRPIADPYPNPVLLIAVGIMVSMVLRALARLLRG